MQKLDFTQHISKIVQQLKSEEITRIFADSFEVKQETHFNYNLLAPLLFESKSNFDALKNIKSLNKILAEFELDEIYSSENLSILVKYFVSNPPYHVFKNTNVRHFWGTHQALSNLLALTQKQLLSDVFHQKYETQLNKGIIIFQIIIDGDGLDAGVYSEIFTNLKELSTTISKINGHDDGSLEIILLDSGSDTNLAIRTTAETAKSLFLIFKEMWEFFTSYKHYRQKQSNQALLDSLSIMAEIKAKKDDGTLTSEDAQNYLYHIKTRTDKLIGLNVAPKQLISENLVIDNVKLLNEMKEIKLLKSEN